MPSNRKKPLKKSGGRTRITQSFSIKKALFYAVRTAYNVPLVYISFIKFIVLLVYKILKFLSQKICDMLVLTMGWAKHALIKLQFLLKKFLFNIFIVLAVVIVLLHRFVKFNFTSTFEFLCVLVKSLKSILLAFKNFAVNTFKNLWKKIPRIKFTRPTFGIRFLFFGIKTLFVFTLVLGIYAFYTFYLSVIKDIPSADALKAYDPNLTTKIYDRKGDLLYSLYFDEDRSLVGMGEIPQNIINATIAIEDESFYKHNGISIRAIARAAKRTFFEDDLQGGSTITQQLVKNIILTPERTYERKIKEVIIALDVERRFTKNQILEMYLNNISYGGTAYGVKSAAKRYFGKELSDLTLAETTYLVGLPGAPSKYSPFGPTPEKGKARQWEVLTRMVSSNYITQEQANELYNEPLTFNDRSESIKYPHFVNYVIQDLETKYGQYVLAKGGLEVYTSIDPEIQDAAQEIATRNVKKFAKNKVSNGAILITNPKSGEVLAMVGSTDYWNINNDGNVNLTTALRQPGSSIKPITYSLALERGYTPYSEIVDEPVRYQIRGQKDYKPVNYDGKFHGKMNLKTALANSYNIPAVKLADQLGVTNLITWGERMGISTWTDRSRFGLSLTLGAGEVKMTDLATAYGVFANQGIKRDLNPILSIYDSYGSTVYENPCTHYSEEDTLKKAERGLFETSAFAQSQAYKVSKENDAPICNKQKTLSSSTAYNITMMLSDNSARTPAFGPNSNLNITKKQIAVKTGTTTNVKDNWAIGYNDDFVVATWIGNNNGDPMINVASGYSSASTLWRESFDYLINTGRVKDKISIPQDLVELEYCPITDSLSCKACSGFDIKQMFSKENLPQEACTNESFIENLRTKHPEYFRSQEDKNDQDGFDSDPI